MDTPARCRIAATGIGPLCGSDRQPYAASMMQSRSSPRPRSRLHVQIVGKYEARGPKIGAIPPLSNVRLRGQPRGCREYDPQRTADREVPRCDDLTWSPTNGTAARPATGPTVLMLHGGGQNRFSWKNTGQILADEGLHVVALDSRGHGDSDRARTRTTRWTRLRRHAGGLDQIGRPVALIGASMGGMTGMLVADVAGPQKVTKLVLVDVVPRYEKDGSARIRDFMVQRIDGFDSLDEAADAVAAYLPYRKKPRSPEGLKKNLRLRDGRWFWHWDPAFLTAPMMTRSSGWRSSRGRWSNRRSHPAHPWQAL